MRYSIFLLLMTWAFINTAQRSVGGLMGVDNGVFNEAIDSDKEDVQGTPYLYDDWYPLVVTTPSGTKLEADKSKIDIHNHRIVIENQGKLIAANDHQVTSFNIKINGFDDKEFIKVGIDQETKYAELLKAGKIVLLKVHNKKFKRGNSAEVASGGYNKTAVSKYSKTNTAYYMSIDGNEPQLIKRSSKGFAKSFPKNQEKRIKSLLKSKKPDLKDDKELIDFITFLEEKLTL